MYIYTSELTRVQKIVYRVFRVFSYSASVSCAKDYHVWYRVLTVKMKFLKINYAYSESTILTIFSNFIGKSHSSVSVSEITKRTSFPLIQNWTEFTRSPELNF